MRRLLAHAVPLLGLVALLAAVELVVVLGIGDVPTAGQRSLLVASTVAAAVTALLYVPLRSRLSAAAARRLLGARDAPAELLSAFGRRLARPLPLDELLLQLVESLRRSMALDAAEVWTGSAKVLERAASDPDAGPGTIVLTPEVRSVVTRAGVSGPTWAATWLPELVGGRGDAELRVVPATHAGELYGLVVVEPSAERPSFSDADSDVLLALARQIGLALHNVRLGSALEASLEELEHQADELRASRARVVAAADAERRRIERDLHDGAQTQLYALAVNVRLARELATSDPDRARELLTQLGGDVEHVLGGFRDLARGIYPSVLVSHGLAEGLRTGLARVPLGARLEVTARGRYGPDVEATVYFCCLEALQNASRYAGEDARVVVRVWEEDGGLHFEVADDGAGFDPGALNGGAGLTNLGDRLGALGGRLVLWSARGQGATVAGSVPLQAPSSSSAR